MIHLFVVDIEQAKASLFDDTSLVESESFSRVFKNGIVNTKGKNTDTLFTSACAYLSLELAFEVIYKKQMPKIMKDNYGKPCFIKDYCGGNIPLFNLSHSKSLVAICFYNPTDSMELVFSKLGVDIQHHKCLQNKELLETKMPENINNCLQNLKKDEISIDFLKLSADGKTLEKANGFSRQDTSVKDGSDKDFFDKWVRTEAVMKADGRGFGAFSLVPSLLLKACIFSFEFTYNSESYSIALALL